MIFHLMFAISKVLVTFRNFCTSKLSNAMKIFNKVIFRNDEEILGVAFNAAKINLQNNPSKVHRRKIRRKMEFRESGKNTFPTFLKNKPWVHKSSPPIKLGQPSKWLPIELKRKHHRRWSTFPLLYRKPLLWRSELIIFSATIGRNGFEFSPKIAPHISRVAHCLLECMSDLIYTKPKFALTCKVVIT